MEDVTKLLLSYARSGGNLQKLEEEMIKDVVKTLKTFPAAKKRTNEEIQDVARNLVQCHMAKRIKEKLKSSSK